MVGATLVVAQGRHKACPYERFSFIVASLRLATKDEMLWVTPLLIQEGWRAERRGGYLLDYLLEPKR